MGRGGGKLLPHECPCLQHVLSANSQLNLGPSQILAGIVEVGQWGLTSLQGCGKLETQGLCLWVEGRADR